MPSVKLAPIYNDQTFIPGTNTPASGYQLFTYVAGSSTKLATYTDSSGTVAQANPIILNASGQPANPIWLATGQAYKFVFASPTDTDPPTSPLKTFDNISGINDASISTSQWQSSGVTPTYISTTSFTLAGDQTTDFHVGRRVQCTVTAGTVYGIITASAYGVLTTVTLRLDGTSALDAGLSTVNLSILRADSSALPTCIINEKYGTDIASAGTINLTNATGNYFHVTGTTAITAITLAQGAERTVVFDGALTLTNGASLILPGAANITTAAGDSAVFRGEAAGVVRCVSYLPASGLTPVAPVSTFSPIAFTTAVTANAITITIPAASPVVAQYAGVVYRATIPANSTITIPALASLGTVTTQTARLMIAWSINNSCLCVINVSGGSDLSETNTFVPTVISGAATSASTLYTATGTTNTIYKLIGFVDSAWTSAVGWGALSNAASIGGFMPMAAMNSLGYGQTWQDVTASRAVGTTYYNLTGRPISVNAVSSASAWGLTINGVSLIPGATYASLISIVFQVPPGQSYSLSSGTLGKWLEMR